MSAKRGPIGLVHRTHLSRGCNAYLLFLGLVTVCVHCAAQADPYRLAQQAYAAGDYRRAAELFARVTATETGLAPAQQSEAGLMLARSLMHAGEPAKAEAPLQAYTRAHPQSAPSRYLLGHLLQIENKPRESLSTLTDAAQLAEPSGEDLRIASLDYVLLNDYADALLWAKRAVEFDAGNAEAWYDLARVQMHESRYDDAIDALHRSIALRPRSAKALDNLGVCLEDQNRTDEALAAYADAVRVTAVSAAPSALPYRDQGKLLVTRSAFGEALPLLRRATQLDGTDAASFAALAAAFTGLQQPANAQEAMERAVALDPANPRLHYQMARIYRTAGQEALAQQEFKQSAALYGHGSSE